MEYSANLHQKGKIISTHVYPLKGGRELEVDRLSLTNNGLENDRLMMVVSTEVEPFSYLTQREVPGLARIVTQVFSDRIILNAENYPQIVLPYDQRASNLVPIKLKKYEAEAIDLGEVAGNWVSNVLQRDNIRLVMQSLSYSRPIDPRYINEECKDSYISFPDNAQLHLITQESVDCLNKLLELKNQSLITFNRFRPNLVVRGVVPLIELAWKRIKINNNEFLVKPTPRCVVITNDQKSGERKGKEPLTTLSELTKNHFGVYLMPTSTNSVIIRPGDEITIIE